MTQLLQQTITGALTGSVYAVVGLGLVVIAQATEIINFGQAAMGTFVTFIAWSLLLRLPYPAGFLLGTIVAFVVGALVERLVIRMVPEKERTGLNPLIVTLGLLFVFYGLTVGIYGGQPHPFPQPFAGPPIDLHGVHIGRASLYLFGVSLALVLALYLLFRHTRLGLVLRATAANRTAAELAGVPTDRMMMLAWGLGIACAGVAGMLLAQLLSLTPNMMDVVLVFAFAAAVVGGLDSMVGTLVGGVLLGVLQSLTGVYLGNVVRWLHLPFNIAQPQQYRDLIALVVIVVLLIVRPQGLFGRKRVVKL